MFVPPSSPLRNLSAADRTRILRSAERDAGVPPWQAGITLLGVACGAAVAEHWLPQDRGLALTVAAVAGAAFGSGWWWVRHALSDLHVRRLLAWEGRCPNCGYDRRQTPVRCPECGTTDQG